ncbi:inositol hexakisphosphate-domain-containing protein, partial [Blyttiomyces helicus]
MADGREGGPAAGRQFDRVRLCPVRVRVRSQMAELGFPGDCSGTLPSQRATDILLNSIFPALNQRRRLQESRSPGSAMPPAKDSAGPATATGPPPASSQTLLRPPLAPPVPHPHSFLPRQQKVLPDRWLALSRPAGLIKNRTGAVLSRGTILKADRFEPASASAYQPTGRTPQHDPILAEVPNFRSVALSIYGVSQPTVPGISTLLTLLDCHPSSSSGKARSAVWISAREEPTVYINRRPFALRDAEDPTDNVRRSAQGISAARLEQMEVRLKEDVEREAVKGNGLVLVHEEIDGTIVPTWVAIDIVHTPREVFDSLTSASFQVRYFRIPISYSPAGTDTTTATSELSYLDDYARAIKNSTIDDALVFSDGHGSGRSTFAMVVAMLIRRAQMVAAGEQDPIPVPLGLPANIGSQIELIAEGESQNRALLRLVYVLERGLQPKASRSAIDWALARGPLIEDLKTAILGNYGCILHLFPLVSRGAYIKQLLDEVIDQCDALTNLRETILMYRVAYSSNGDVAAIGTAVRHLERYFTLLAFCAYIDDQLREEGFGSPFSEWLVGRKEIWRMLQNFRRKGPRLSLFRPVEDLTIFSEDNAPFAGLTQRPFENELEKYVIKSRQGTVLVAHTILKVDQWLHAPSPPSVPAGLSDAAGVISPTPTPTPLIVDGAYNFRQIPGLEVFGVAQPTVLGIKNVVHALADRACQAGKAPLGAILWINLREEPLCYVNGIPYVLRDKQNTLRNIKSYSGITGTRLEVLEAKLKDDVIQELQNYEDRLLLHVETPTGQILGQWEDCRAADVLSLREVMDVIKSEEHAEDAAAKTKNITVTYHRVPITAETPPEASDFDEILSLLCRTHLMDTAIVLNCQMGVGRSTMGTVVTALVLYWLSSKPTTPAAQSRPRLNYQVIHSLLRVVRNGIEAKQIVDTVIDQCDATINLRDSIETMRVAADNASDDETRKIAVKKGIVNLKRYFLLIA